MTILIGITQSPEKTEEHLCMEFKEVGTRAIVGPFRSAEDASSWMQFMMTRAKDYQQVSVPAPSSGANWWYGFTFERLESKVH